MIEHSCQLRILYADTDKMGFVYYGNYAKFYEYGRTETIRTLGIPYSQLEASGIAMPVIEMYSRFIKPAFYDDLITIKTVIKKLPETRMEFFYEIYNQSRVLLNEGKTTLIFLDIKRNKPVRAPSYLINQLKAYFE